MKADRFMKIWSAFAKFGFPDPKTEACPKSKYAGVRNRLWIAVIGTFGLISGCGFGSSDVQSYDSVRAGYRPSETLLLDRHGAVLHELRTDRTVRRLGWTELADISPSLRLSVVAAEDKRFYDHEGIDYRALAAAALRGLFSGTRRGASTISMQLAAMLEKRLQPAGGRRSLRQKWLQLLAAASLEHAWSKDRILEAYLNLTFFRGEHQGVAAASRSLFGKEPHGLDRAESLVLAALIRAPNAAAEPILSRALHIGRVLGWPADDAEIRGKAIRALQARPGIRQRHDLSPHLARRILNGRSGPAEGGIAVTSTLDAELQGFITERLAHHLLQLKPQNVGEGAVLVVDNESGDVLAYASLTSDPDRSRYVDGVKAKRQAGSTLKPFLYALALDRRVLTAASIVDGSPLDVPVPTGIYQPRNYDGEHPESVSVRQALASSLNVPAVRTVDMIGVETFLECLRALGIDGVHESADFFGPSVALGTADVTLWELVNAYRALACRGFRRELHLERETRPSAEPQRVFSEESAFLVSDILADREARHLTFGLESVLATRFWTAVKTGTSKDMRDNWCLGYSLRFTTGVWVGNYSGEPMWDVSGLTGAAPLWLEIMDRLHRGDPGAPPVPPPGLLHRSIVLPEGPRAEWFIRGTEPNSVHVEAQSAVPRIVYPAPGAVFAVDPDIPLSRQQIFFAAHGPCAGLHWYLDGRPLSPAHTMAAWFPAPGRHVLSLTDPHGASIDSVRFQVRGQVDSTE